MTSARAASGASIRKLTQKDATKKLASKRCIAQLYQEKRVASFPFPRCLLGNLVIASKAKQSRDLFLAFKADKVTPWHLPACAEASAGRQGLSSETGYRIYFPPEADPPFPPEDDPPLEEADFSSFFVSFFASGAPAFGAPASAPAAAAASPATGAPSTIGTTGSSIFSSLNSMMVTIISPACVINVALGGNLICPAVMCSPTFARLEISTGKSCGNSAGATSISISCNTLEMMFPAFSAGATPVNLSGTLMRIFFPFSST